MVVAVLLVVVVVVLVVVVDVVLVVVVVVELVVVVLVVVGEVVVRTVPLHSCPDTDNRPCIFHYKDSLQYRLRMNWYKYFRNQHQRVRNHLSIYSIAVAPNCDKLQLRRDCLEDTCHKRLRKIRIHKYRDNH